MVSRHSMVSWFLFSFLNPMKLRSSESQSEQFWNEIAELALGLPPPPPSPHSIRKKSGTSAFCYFVVKIQLFINLQRIPQEACPAYQRQTHLWGPDLRYGGDLLSDDACKVWLYGWPWENRDGHGESRHWGAQRKTAADRDWLFYWAAIVRCESIGNIIMKGLWTKRDQSHFI